VVGNLLVRCTSGVVPASTVTVEQPRSRVRQAVLIQCGVRVGPVFMRVCVYACVSRGPAGRLMAWGTLS